MTLTDYLHAWAKVYLYKYNADEYNHPLYGTPQGLEVIVKTEGGDIVLMAHIPYNAGDYMDMDFYPPHFVDNQISGYRGKDFDYNKLRAIIIAEEEYAAQPGGVTYHKNNYNFR